MTNLRSNLLKQGICCPDPVKTMQMTQMAGVTRMVYQKLGVLFLKGEMFYQKDVKRVTI